MDERSELVVDLAEKLERLRWRLEQPELFINEHFAAIRNEIDADCERLIHDFKENSKGSERHYFAARDVEKVNSSRTKFIEFLDKMEQLLFVKLQTAPTLTTLESLTEIEERFVEFSASKELSNANETEENYLKLALDLIEATNEAERRLLDSQTFAYMPAKRNEIGNLVYLSSDFLNRDEVGCLKLEFYNFLQRMHETIQASLNSSLAVPVTLPFVISRNMLIIFCIVKLSISPESSNGKVVYFEGFASDDLDDLYAEKGSFFKKMRIDSSRVLCNPSFHPIEVVHLGQIESSPDRFFISMCRNRLRRLELADSLMPFIDQLDLNDNQLEAFDGSQLAGAVKLRSLQLASAFLPDTRFSLGFLASLVNLTELRMTLPDAAIDFQVFQNLIFLKRLELKSAASLDSNFERPRLTREHMKNFLGMTRLHLLSLSCFKIERLAPEMFGEFTELNSLCLIDNAINHIDDGVFQNCFGNKSKSKKTELRNNSIRLISAKTFQGFSSHRRLDLSYNRIEQLLPGVFVELASLEHLHLNNNSIRHVTRGVFNELTHLDTLVLDDNSIESIEARSFDGLSVIKTLSLSNCRLNSIDNQMFCEMNHLRTLNLDNNEIETFEVVDGNERRTINGIMSPAEFDLVRESLFCGTPALISLSLSGNKLEKLDLNCFFNLVGLEMLDLSSNQISELNDEIRPNVLLKLRELNLRHNLLTRVDRRAFNESSKLKNLKLSDNKLVELDEEFFEPFEDLERVELQNNNLTINVTSRTFTRCSKLTEINLLNNSNVTVEDGAFCQLEQLSTLRLQVKSNDSFFHNNEQNLLFLTRVEELSLANSSIESLEFLKNETRFSQLKELDLSMNTIKHIARESLFNLTSLRRFNLSNNLIESLDDVSLFETTPSLRSLNLSGNKLKHIHRKFFKCLSKLESLDLSHNPALSSIDSGFFRGLYGLRELNLADNNIAFFDLIVLYQSCRLLESIDLSNNQLDNKSINEESMSGSTAQNLKQLKLSNNRLEKMDFVRNLYRLEKLDLSGNKIDSVTSNGVNLLGRLVKLKHVNLNNNQIKSLEIKTIFSHLKCQIEFLDLSNNLYNSNMSNQSSTNCYLFIDEK